MIIDFMLNSAEPRVLEKNPISIIRIEGALRNDSPISSPSILVEDVDDYVTSANYAYIQEFGRYYYIQEVTHLRNKLWVVDMVCDVLMSFSNSIKFSMALIESTTDEGIERVNNYMASDSFVSLVKHKTDIISFSSGFTSDPYFILITAGGIVS